MKTPKLTSSVKMTSPPGTGGASELYVADGFNFANRKRACNHYKCIFGWSESASSSRVETSVGAHKMALEKKCRQALAHTFSHDTKLPMYIYIIQVLGIRKRRKLLC